MDPSIESPAGAWCIEFESTLGSKKRKAAIYDIGVQPGIAVANAGVRHMVVLIANCDRSFWCDKKVDTDADFGRKIEARGVGKRDVMFKIEKSNARR